MSREMPTPRYDFYQTSSHLIVAVYLKGYAAEGVKDQVHVTFSAGKVVIVLPSLTEEEKKDQVTLDPLYAEITPAESSHRVLSTKIELKLAKAEPLNWPSLLSTGSTIPAGSASATATATSTISSPAPAIPQEKPRPQRRNWDKFEVEEEEKSTDPNAGGEDALKKLFSTIYKDASDDTKRAMIKSYTESGGTTLSTDWSKIGKEKTPVQPPDGMEARKYD